MHSPNEREQPIQSEQSTYNSDGSHIHLVPLGKIAGFDVRPGLYEMNGATAIPGGVNFTVHTKYGTACELLLFHRESNEPYAVLPFPEQYKIGNVYSMIVFKLDIFQFEYAYRIDGPYDPENGLVFDKTKYLLDPYAKAVTGQSMWRTPAPTGQHYKARVVRDDFDWMNSKQPLIPMQELIIYEMHVRGFTVHDSSDTTYPGTFSALMEKIPYLKKLGINAVELLPIFEFDEMLDERNVEGNKVINYWGYNTVSFFAPNTSYAASKEYNREGNELKHLIKALNENGIEVILDVVFNHTAEGNEEGPFFSFKGFDNKIYYLLTPDGKYYNFSGCGNTLNCNHPIVLEMIVQCLRYWVSAYRVDGFRFDLASILGRNEDGSPMDKPPLLQRLAFDPLLGNVKLIAEAWDAGGLYQVGNFPSWNRWAEWNGRYRDDIRRFLKGDDDCAMAAALRIAGSPDIYDASARKNASINFITCHDGFTLHDLYTYNEKHNEKNGWNNTDGANDNHSWNCGTEGETSNAEIRDLRERMVRNAFAVLLCSRGTPMLLSGDEFGNTQFGNNNSYCQDNEISWLNWNDLKTNASLFEFVCDLIAYRKKHTILQAQFAAAICGFPEISFHCTQPWCGQYTATDHYIGVMFAGRSACCEQDDIVYVAVNSFWEPLEITLPQPGQHQCWQIDINTMENNLTTCDGFHLHIAPRSVAVLSMTDVVL